jgi:hypothetical protein
LKSDINLKYFIQSSSAARRNYFSLITLFFYFTVVPTSLIGQNVETSLLKFLLEVKVNPSLELPSELLDRKNAQRVLTQMPKYLSDSSNVMRSKAYEITGIIGLKSNSDKERQQAVVILAMGILDRDPFIVSIAINYLRKYKSKDFVTMVRDSLSRHISKPIACMPIYLQLMGELNMTQIRMYIQHYSQPGNPQPIRWAALLALSRMNDQTATNAVLTRVKKIGINDDVIYEIFPDLIYTRQRAAFDYIITELHSDKTNCTSADNDNPVKIPCGYRIMEMLAPVIKDYPLALDASGDVKTKDYKKALETVRNWFNKKGNNYEIITEGM